MKSYLRGFLVAALLWCGIGPLFAAEQTNFLGTVFIADPTTTSYQLKVNSDGSINVVASVSASVSGFTPSSSGARGTPLSVTTSDSSGNLPTGAVVVVSNAGANLMYCNVNGIAATTSDQPITANDGWFAFTIPSGVTTLHCIGSGGSTTANTLGGSGLPTGTGGGSGGGVQASGSDGSTSISSGGTAQNLFSGSTPTHGWEICDPNVTDDLWASQSTTAAVNGQGSMRIAANGGCVSSPAGMAPFHAISVIGPNTGDKITAVQW